MYCIALKKGKRSNRQHHRMLIPSNTKPRLSKKLQHPNESPEDMRQRLQAVRPRAGLGRCKPHQALDHPSPT
ncbi:hypothetical protein M419DRAFT_124745 [Trichoderma reesei RUT C-30]|uniref:Uncharacterized protein n=1 Tax=Hypocrea jecorina (strain ATCC 56765 / BCRC 32924 / NRRL 11460 / Rut C-30) TaxID=1344414 RepID=A0A024S316_HYPJR|nr:hypothetical protein M419DRAFT_124745 [Trichoderma reesei RUT C-30]